MSLEAIKESLSASGADIQYPAVRPEWLAGVTMTTIHTNMQLSCAAGLACVIHSSGGRFPLGHGSAYCLLCVIGRGTTWHMYPSCPEGEAHEGPAFATPVGELQSGATRQPQATQAILTPATVP